MTEQEIEDKTNGLLHQISVLYVQGFITDSERKKITQRIKEFWYEEMKKVKHVEP